MGASGRLRRTSVAVGSLVVVALLPSGCIKSSREEARDRAIEAVRADAENLRLRLENAGRGESGEALLKAVRQVITAPLEAEEAKDSPEGVVVTGALTELRHAGGGLWYDAFTAQLCLRYTVARETGKAVVVDAPCPPGIDDADPSTETVLLND